MTTTCYIIRHGKTMFNTLGRAQGWCDTPLTETGKRGILELALGLKAANLSFQHAYSSDSGRTVETMNILLNGLDLPTLPYQTDPRIREWCFGSFDGVYDSELFDGLMPRVLGKAHVYDASYEELATALVQADTANWAEPWSQIKKRILSAFTEMAEKAEKQGGGNLLIVSHGMTIGSFVWLISGIHPHGLDNGCVTTVTYEKGAFHLGKIGDMSYRKKGKLLLDQQ